MILSLAKSGSTILNQIFCYTGCITPKRVTSLRCPSPRHWSSGNTAFFEEMSQLWQAVGNIVSDLTGSGFKPQTSRSRDERVTARPTGVFDNMKRLIYCNLLSIV